jgi:hypothetical protein
VLAATGMLLSSLASGLRQARTFARVIRTQGPAARRDSGKSIAAQAAEIVALRRGVGRLGADEYYQYRLYDDRRFTWEQKKQFLGRWMEDALVPILKETGWLGLANDKVIAYAFLRGLGFPIPEPFAVYHAWRHCGGIPVHRTKAALEQAVRTLGRSFVAKPVNGMWGRNVTAVRAYDPSRDAVVLTNGSVLGVEALVERIDHVNEMGGMLLQELLAPHPSIQERCGDRICSVRMVTVIDQRGPRLIATVWKVATGGSMADNYWEPGNLIAPIDPESGVVGRTFTGLGLNIRHVDTHPDTGQALPGFELPDWRQAVELCLSATGAIPRLPMQAWDIALTSRGPVLLEVNVNGGMRLPQLCAEAGLLRGEFATFLSRFGFPRPLRDGRKPSQAGHTHAHGHN